MTTEEAGDTQSKICEKLSQAAYETTHENLLSAVQQTPGARLCQTWTAQNSVGGYSAYTAALERPAGEGNVLALVFRGTAGAFRQEEWAENVSAMKRADTPLTDNDGDGDRKVFALWRDLIDKLWTHPGAPAEGANLSMEQTLRSHLGGDGELWITGHSRGGALATVAAARLVMSPHPDADKLRRMSVLTFNAPKALCTGLGNDYEEKHTDLGVNHRCLFNKGDFVRRTPFGWYRHVGKQEEHGRRGGLARGLLRSARVVGVASGVTLMAGGGLAISVLAITEYGAATVAAGAAITARSIL